MSARHRPRPMPSALVRAAGAIVWRFRAGFTRVEPRIGQIIDPNDIEVLVVHRPRYNDWSWPKGKVESGELLAAAAVREVEEETGEVIRLGAPLTIQRYRLGNGHIKEVHYWVGRQAGGSPAARIRPPVQRASHKEIDDCRWVSVADAHEMLTRRGDRRLLSEVCALAESGVLVTEPVLLMRPAQTVERERWEGVLGERHLTRAGVRQSLDAIDVLAAFGVQEIHSSQWNCAQLSLAPYACTTGLHTHTYSELTEPAIMSNPEGMSAFICSLIKNVHSPAVVAVHRQALPGVIETLRRHADIDVRASLPTSEPALRPAEILVAHIGVALPKQAQDSEDKALVSIEQRPAPRPVPKPGPHIVTPSAPSVQSVKVCTAPRQIQAVERHAIPLMFGALVATSL